jgi:hypothetical protein
MPHQDWVSVGEYTNRYSASAISIRLTTEGVPHRVVSSGLPDRDSTRWIEVPPEWADRAKEILVQPAVPEDELTEEALRFSRADDVNDITSSKHSIDSLLLQDVRQRPKLSIVVTLWSLLLVFGVPMLVTKGPLKAPSFEQLTEYLCDPLPPLATLGNRFQQYGLRITCRAGDQLIYQRQSVFNVSNQSGRLNCRRDGGYTRIWRMAPPAAYGEIVFHAVCGDHIVIDYKNSAANYESNKVFVTLLGCAIIILSTSALVTRWYRSQRSRQHARSMPL